MRSILEKLHNVKGDGNQYTAQCPGHEDKNNSLSISKGEDGKILLFCHAGCDPEHIVDSLGMKMGDLFPSKQKEEKRIAQIYAYTDVDGNILHETIRYKPKGFSQRRPDGKGGYRYDLKGVKTVLYNLPGVIQAIKENKTIYICEGEKDCENLGKLGLTATTSPMGAGKWKNEYSDYLIDSHIVILPDNDKPGKEHAIKIAKTLTNKAASCKIIELPDLPEHGDITDFFRKHGKTKGLEMFQKLVDEATAINESSKNLLTTIDAKTLKEKQLPPVIFTIDRLMSTGLSILAAPPKAGKSWLALWFCLQIAQGLPIWTRKTRKGTVLYLALEDSLNRLQSRLSALSDETPDNLYFAIESDAIANGLEEQLNDFVLKHNDTVLIVVDTLQKVRQLRKNENAYATDYSDAGALKRFADKYGLSILVIHHTRKMADNDPFNTISGSTGLTGAADSMFVIQKQSRTSQEAILHATGRDIDPQELAIRFNESKTWELISNDASQYMEQKALNENPLIILCSRFLESHVKFEGTATELHPLLATQMKPDEHFRFPMNGQGLSRELMALQSKLKLKGILIERARTPGSRKIRLQKISSNASYASQASNNSTSQHDAIKGISSYPSCQSNHDDNDATMTQLEYNDTAEKDSDNNTYDANDVNDANILYIDNLLSDALEEG
jgi:hypothetical protein